MIKGKFLFIALLAVSLNVQAQQQFEKLVKMPEFPGGTTAMLQFIKNNLQYPERALLHEVEGTALASFTVGPDGAIKDITVKDGGVGNKDCLTEARRLIFTMPNWIPGESASGKTAARVNVPIRFVMGKKEKKLRRKLLKKMAKENRNRKVAPRSMTDAERNYPMEDKNYQMLQDGAYVPVELDQEPEYIEGEEAKARTMGMNIRYPAAARNTGVEGVVVVSVLLDETGQVKKTELVKGIGAGCDEEALKVVKLLAAKGFTPAIKGGIPVSVKFDIPIRFGLE